MAMSQYEKDFRKALRTQGLTTEPVDSSWIRSATYDPQTETLLINMVTDYGPSSYAYGSVDWRTAASLFFADSPGARFNEAIRDGFAYVKLF